MTLEDNIKLLEENIGKGKLFPKVPSCKYKGVEVPRYVAFSESGGITGTILTNIFRKLYSFNLYNDIHQSGIAPFVLLDIHGLHFEIEFLEYVNCKEHLWNVCLSMP